VAPPTVVGVVKLAFSFFHQRHKKKIATAAFGSFAMTCREPAKVKKETALTAVSFLLMNK
jgi:hypothetical protein